MVGFIQEDSKETADILMPWAGKAFIKFIDPKLNKNMDIFEFGCGYSTLFYAGKVKTVRSVEHNIKWINKIKNKIPENVEIIFNDPVDMIKYPKSILETNKKFDIIFIDAMDRINCIKNALHCLKNNGVIILDDSERKKYRDFFPKLTNMDFKYLDIFEEISDNKRAKCTTIFYKKLNCLDISNS